jgi:hypothetical protein
MSSFLYFQKRIELENQITAKKGDLIFFLTICYHPREIYESAYMFLGQRRTGN